MSDRTRDWTADYFKEITTMNYQGTIIEESLDDPAVLSKINIVSTKVEIVTEKHRTPWLKQWTLHKVEISEDQCEAIADMLASSLQKNYWYADFMNDKYHYIIYSGKIFKVDRQNPVFYKDAKKYGLDLGIPSYQIDFAPDDPIWRR
ncbi:MAG: hypothetical protein A3B10_01405 [Candidatus Doudnabacteria bacterium RIFCSPLOWO2_01_FULL_44_21]|uniref:Uncharacterized protein n=1 Tax=Candidatus Doudnabacteria bacterium RIFCSPLOWO2_01_FULL_44_21 TaxID=1817841 RepID=A0A1F5PWZ3_9BACT|nr:MAG: hypothetical protein A3B10_01405 [Candidatus Doudnabacteria bacterium RIFCSPLOWO2_01_FULL_44_21]